MIIITDVLAEKCSKCGAKVSPGYDFCLTCGTKFSEHPPLTYGESTRSRFLDSCIVSIIVGIIAVLVFVFFILPGYFQGL